MFSIFRDADKLQHVEARLDQMLSDCRRMYRLATDAIFGVADPDDVKDELWALDKNVNRTERAIRRELLVHGTVRGAETDLGLMLAYMSVSKDIERIGDYCKNTWDLAALGVDLSGDGDSAELRAHAEEVAELLSAGSAAFISQDESAVHSLIPRLEENAEHYDNHVDLYVKSEEPGYVAAPRALYYRFLKRISAHMSNVLSAVVMPVDRIDFYKESKAAGGLED